MRYKLMEHPTVRSYQQKAAGTLKMAVEPVDSEWLRNFCLQAGADDVGFVELGRQELNSERKEITETFPETKSLISVVCRLNRGPIRSPARSIANTEFHQTIDRVNEVCHEIVSVLEERGIRSLNPSGGFPMEADRWGGRIWTVSHKLVAVAAGLGQMGIHRNVIHPKFGSFILLGTILVDAKFSSYNRPIEYNPCVECKLCVAACPTGAIHSDGYFDFSACYTHNYREFMGGFMDWVETVVGSKNGKEYREKVSDSETVSLWQSLSFGANYKAAYCVAVCPAGEDVIGPFLNSKPEFLQSVVKPLQEKKETIYVVSGSDVETHVARRFPNKTTKKVGNGLRLFSIRQFLDGLRLTFQKEKSAGLNAVYHFTFTGDEQVSATISIRDKQLEVEEGLLGSSNLRVTADSRTWLAFLNKEKSLLLALLGGKIRMKGSPRLLRSFAKCFPA